MNYTQKKYEEIIAECKNLEEIARALYHKITEAPFYDIDVIQNALDDIKHIEEKVKPFYLEIQDYWIDGCYHNIKNYADKLEEILIEQVGLSETLNE